MPHSAKQQAQANRLAPAAAYLDRHGYHVATQVGRQAGQYVCAAAPQLEQLEGAWLNLHNLHLQGGSTHNQVSVKGGQSQPPHNKPVALPFECLWWAPATAAVDWLGNESIRLPGSGSSLSCPGCQLQGAHLQVAVPSLWHRVVAVWYLSSWCSSSSSTYL